MLVTLDFETYHDKDYTLRKQSTSEYVRDERFEAISCAIKVDDGPTQVYFGEEIRRALGDIQWSEATLLAHHTHFDGLIASHHYGCVPARYADTLSMGRALHPKSQRNSLEEITKLYPEVKHHKSEMPDFKGKHLADLTADEIAAVRIYNAGDVDATYEVYAAMTPLMPSIEMDLIDITVRMFADPILRVDIDKATKELRRERREKNKAINNSGVEKKVLSSDKKFVAALEALGIIVPTKLSKPGKKHPKPRPIPAIAKSDEDLQNFLVHPNPDVVRLVAGRLAAKSTIGESRATRMLLRAERGMFLPIYLNYAGAHTHRWSGGDKFNPQNFKQLAKLGGALRAAICAPEGQRIVVVDASQIEARITAWLAGEESILQAFREGRDIYSEFATKVYGRLITKKDKKERFVGKTCILGLGFGMGHVKLIYTLLTQSVNQGLEPVRIDAELSKYLVDLYRSDYKKIAGKNGLWKKANNQWIAAMMHEDKPHVHKCLRFSEGRMELPNGLALLYPGLDANIATYANGEEEIHDASYLTIMGHSKLYGGLLVENAAQALARIFVAEVMRELAYVHGYRIVMMTHDEIAFLARDDDADNALKIATRLMATPPSWAPNLPLDSEGGFDQCYTK